MARKKDELGTKEKTIHFRVSEAFYEVIAHEAKQCGLSISEFCRRVLLNRPIKKLPVIIQYLKEGGEFTKPILDKIEKVHYDLDISIHDFNRAVESEYEMA